MKSKNLIPLVAIVVVLGVLIVLKSTKDKPIPIEQAVELASLMPDGLQKTDLAKIELYTGAAPDTKVILERNPDNAELWRVATHFNAPVDKKQIDDYLSLLIGLRGEVRERNVPDDGLKQFKLTPEEAFHVIGYKKDSESAAFEVLVGSQAGYKQVFARAKDKSDVIIVDKSPRGEAGIFGDDMAKAPEPTKWVDKAVVDLEQDKITRVAIQTPDKHLVFEKREKPQETPPPPTEGSQEQPPAPPAPEFEWALAEGGPGQTFKQPGLDTLLRQLDAVNAVDAVDPAKLADWGLESPSFKCAVTASDKKEEVVIEGGRPDPAGDGYVRLAGDTRGVVYKISKYNFEQLFAIGKSLNLFDVAGFSTNSDEITQVEITQPEGNIKLTRTDGKWSVVEPLVPIQHLSTPVDAMVAAVSGWNPADYVDLSATTGLELSARILTLGMKDGTTHTYKLGNDSKVLDGAYVQLDQQPMALVMTRADIDKIFLKPGDLFDKSLLDFDETKVSAVTMQREADSFSLSRKDATWTINAGGIDKPAESGKVDALLMAIATLEAEELRFNESSLSEPAAATLVISMETGESHTLMLTTEKEHHRMALNPAIGVVAVVDSLDAAELLPASATLCAPEPPAGVPPAAPAPTPVSDAPAAPAPETPAMPASASATELPAIEIPANATPAAAPSGEIPSAPPAPAPPVASSPLEPESAAPKPIEVTLPVEPVSPVTGGEGTPAQPGTAAQ